MVKHNGVVTTTHGGPISDIHGGALADMWASLMHKSFLLELVSNDRNGLKVTAYASRSFFDVFPKETHEYHCTFDVPENFGEIGAVLVDNEYSTKIFFVSIVLDNGVTFTCDSWVHSKHDNPERRIFFTNKSYLPSQTPEGLKDMRAKDLECLRGDGTGERKPFDRIYDYDVYNDLGGRPVLGGNEHPYPRRCRTGRNVENGHELRITADGEEYFYVPIDEDFSEIKTTESALRTLMNLLHTQIPTLESIVTNEQNEFPQFRSINFLYNEDSVVPTPLHNLQRFIKKILGWEDDIFQFTCPEIITRDSFSWLNDEEFCRQMLAGINPCSIQLVKEWPLKSKLKPEVYGPVESAITKDHVEKKIKGYMTFEKALEHNKLFMLDYHDLLLPYVNKTRDLEGTTLYGSRTILFLTPDGTLMPVAIELTRPYQSDDKPQWNYVYQPTSHATDAWLWKLAKAHVLAHDSAHHQLVSHWLRSHCVSEPYIISTHRNLSQVHPIYRLLFPHFRFTMQINALAREKLINANGVIESTFSPAEYCMELCSDVYKTWRFEHEALPADLINRGMAIEDINAPYGVKLMIEDYPYANDGLRLWAAIEEWANSYVDYYYAKADQLVKDDEELQAWWKEICEVGHKDKEDATWWPKLETRSDLIKIVSTIIWVVSGHHAAVNFGQYDFAGYFPNRPTIARTNMPNEDHMEDGEYSEEWKLFLERPEAALLKCFPSRVQAMKVMSLLDVLSDHSPDEIYVGEKIEPAWDADHTIKNAFETFRGRLKELEVFIDTSNKDPELKNRSGAGIVPYQLLKPYSASDPKKGVPNSVSI